MPTVTSAIEQNFLKKSFTNDSLLQDDKAQSQDCNLFVSGNIVFAIWSVLIPQALAFFFDSALGFLEYTGVMAFGQLDGAYAFATYLPFVKVVIQSVGLGLAASTANLLIHSFLRKHSGSSQKSFCFFIYFIIGWALLSGPLIGLFSDHISSSLDGGLSSFHHNHSIYLFLIGVTDLLSSLFSILISYFLIFENRIILNASRQIFVASLACTFQIVAYFYIQSFNNYQKYLYNVHIIQDLKDIKYVSPLTGTALGPLLSQIIISIWIMFLFTDITIFGIPHKGTLRLKCCRKRRTVPKGSFSLNDRSQPKASQILKKMFVFFPQNYLTYSYTPCAILLINSVMNITYDKENHQKILYNRLSNLIYMRSYSVFNAIQVAVALSFRVVGMYTLRSGLYLRTKRLFTMCLLHTLLLPPILCLSGMFFSTSIVTALTPKMEILWEESTAEEMVRILPVLEKTFRAAALSPILTGSYYLVLSICEMESKWLPSLLLSLGRIAVCMVSILCNGFILGDSVDFIPSIFFGDIFASIVGILYSIYYWSKYTHLAAIEEARTQLESLDEQLNRHNKEEHSSDDSNRKSLDHDCNRYTYMNRDYGSTFDTGSSVTE